LLLPMRARRTAANGPGELRVAAGEAWSAALPPCEPRVRVPARRPFTDSPRCCCCRVRRALLPLLLLPQACCCCRCKRAAAAVTAAAASMLLRMTRWVVVDVATYFFGFVSPAPELAWLRLRADVLLYAVGFCCCGCRVTVFVSVILEG
jgi:hypothetical protein